ncbi:LOW QUALITY PROTEIN: hypothetical protein ACHAXH_009388 [Discostella pseudostelligera]
MSPNIVVAMAVLLLNRMVKSSCGPDVDVWMRSAPFEEYSANCMLALPALPFMFDEEATIELPVTSHEKPPPPLIISIVNWSKCLSDAKGTRRKSSIHNPTSPPPPPTDGNTFNANGLYT